MKRSHSLALMGLSCFALAACGSPSPSSSAQQSSSGQQSSATSGVSSTSILPSYSRAPYSGGDFTPPAAQEWTLKANAPTNALRGDFAFGVDVSSLAEVEAAGGKFYNKEGQEEDVFKILAEGGSNYARLRLWHNPYDKNGNPYGGGTNDLRTTIALAKRAKAAGMKICLDFHYSDSWVDPGKFWAPKAWSDMFFDDKLKALFDYTMSTLETFKNEGIELGAVQIGNEVNPGIAGVASSNSKRMANIFASAANAVHYFYPEAKTICHLTDINNPTKVFNFVDGLQKNSALPDVIGVSYYPYWHGDLNNLQNVLNMLSNYGTEVMVMETSWGYTDEEHEAAGNQFNSNTLGLAGGYATSTQAQVTELADIVDVLSKVPGQKGTGIFYWEPAWLPAWGSGWISKYGAYYNEYGKDWVGNITEAELDAKYDKWYCRSSWANQALFDYEGHYLPSASAYRHIAAGDHPLTEEIDHPINEKEVVKVDISDTWALPTSVRFITNLDAYREVPVVWNDEDVAKITKSGSYVVKGVAGGKEITAEVTAIKNYITNGGFEAEESTKPAAVISPWACETTNNYKEVGDAHVACEGEMGGRGNHYFHFYSTSPLEFKLSQPIGTMKAGKYDFGFEANACWYGGDNAGDATIDSAKFYYTVDGVRNELDIREQFIGYNNGHAYEIAFPTITLEKDSVVTIGLDLKGGAKSWGHMDNFYFADHAE